MSDEAPLYDVLIEIFGLDHELDELGEPVDAVDDIEQDGVGLLVLAVA